MKNKGFTLIEIVIAIAVFAIIASITSSILYQSFQIKERSHSQADLINELQLAIALLDRDAKQIVERPVRGNQMHLFPSFIGQEDYLEFTRGGTVNPMASENKSTLTRVAYLCKRNSLIRRIWSNLDSPDRDNYHDTIMLNNLKYCSFAYVGLHQNIVPSWHQYSTRRRGKTITTPLPKAIQLTLNVNKLGKVKLAFII
ncbi:MAG: type II secretion system minor pseudopilin GspJ [Legionellaceae bacterium]|nr:type II secretion system minor pseudopilin GspJ [Legionellaceae bacterium]